MRTHVQIARTHKFSRSARAVRRPIVSSRTAARSPALNLDFPSSLPADAHAIGFQSAPHVDYGRFLTPEGGILILYKDLDLRFRHTLWRFFAWTVSTGCEGWFLLQHSPLRSAWITAACLVAVAVVNWLIVAKPVEVSRSVEIRPDCMILEGSDVFWLRLIEELPAFHPDEEGNQVLSGIYGTRFVEYLTARRFDENDRQPEVFLSHLQLAMHQLWEPALATGTERAGTSPHQGR